MKANSFQTERWEIVHRSGHVMTGYLNDPEKPNPLLSSAGSTAGISASSTRMDIST